MFDRCLIMCFLIYLFIAHVLSTGGHPSRLVVGCGAELIDLYSFIYSFKLFP